MNALIENLSSVECLGLTIIGEARGEPIQGQVAVGSVIRNRLHDNPKKYKNYNDVCLEPKQFSCWNENDSNYPILLDLARNMITGVKVDDPYYRQCLWVAKGIEDWSIRDNTKGAQHYITKELASTDTPKWAKNMINPVPLGNQIFFNV